MAIDFLLLISRQGKVRLAKYYVPVSRKDKARTEREVTTALRCVLCIMSVRRTNTDFIFVVLGGCEGSGSPEKDVQLFRVSG